MRFAFEGLDGLGCLLRAQVALTHLLDSHEPVAKQRIRGLVDGSEAALTNLANNMITLLERVMLSKQSSERADGKPTRGSLQRVPTGEAKRCLRRVVCATFCTVKMSRSDHIFYSSPLTSALPSEAKIYSSVNIHILYNS